MNDVSLKHFRWSYQRLWILLTLVKASSIAGAVLAYCGLTLYMWLYVLTLRIVVTVYGVLLIQFLFVILIPQDSDNPDLRDRGYIYWRLLSTDPAAAKEVVLAEKPLISEETDLLEPTLLDELICHISSLASVYHKPPNAFVEGRGGVPARRVLPPRFDCQFLHYAAVINACFYWPA